MDEVRDHRPTRWMTLALTGLVTLGACSGSDSASSSTGEVLAADTGGAAPSATTGAAAFETVPEGFSPAESAEPGGGGTPLPAPQGETSPSAPPIYRAVISTATMTVTVTDVAAAAADVRAAAVAAGGFVASSEESAEDDGTATVTIKVPPGDFDRLLRELGALGEVASRQIESVDVTDQVVDLDARTGAMQASVDRLITLMGRSNNVTEIAAVEAELTRRTAELEALEGQLRVLESQVSLSTITLVLRPPVVAPVEPFLFGVVDARPSFLDGLRSGWRALVDTAQVVALVVGALLPWMIPGAFVLAFALTGRRLRRRGRSGPGPELPADADRVPVAV